MRNLRYLLLTLFLRWLTRPVWLRSFRAPLTSGCTFPNFIDGGPSSGQFQTKLNLNFVTPNVVPANVRLNFFGDDGSPIGLNFGSGLSTSLVVLRSVFRRCFEARVVQRRYWLDGSTEQRLRPFRPT